MSDESRSELGIVFIHHRTDAVTLNNLQSFRDWNPEATIVTMSAEQSLPEGYSIQEMPEWLERWRRHTANSNLRAKSTDFLLFAWYQNRREDCDRWLVVEWDSYCACPVAEFFGELFDADVVGSTVLLPEENDSWWWFCKKGSLPEAMQPYAAGIAPFSFVLFSDNALSAMSRAVPSGDLGNGNGELRIGTLARYCGFHPWSNRCGLGYNDWRPLREGEPIGRGMWHPVKWLVNSRNTVTRDPQEIVNPPEKVILLQRDIGDRVRYLNLERHSERRVRMEGIFSLLGIAATRVSATDGRLLKPIAGKNMAEVAVTIGQKKMWEEVATCDKPFALFEDDVIFCKRFREYWHEREFTIPLSTDILFLGLSWPTVTPFAGYEHLHSVCSCYGCFAYILFPSGARKLIEAEQQNPQIVCDHYTHHLLKNGVLRGFSPKPSWCITQWAESSIAPRFSDPVPRFGGLFEDVLVESGGGQKDWVSKLWFS